MKDVVQRKLDSYNPQNPEDEENALKEITQDIALYALYKTGFFQKASFLGGTSLRILHRVDRFSEDLDFSTVGEMKDFRLETYLSEAMVHMNAYGYDLSISGKEKADGNVQSRFLKDDSIKKILTFKHTVDSRSKIKIKVEIDTNPPEYAVRQMEYANFPVDFPVMTYDLSSLMAGKLHALLCRPYCKGRDLFDFLWYISNDIVPNYKMLASALFQVGPWQGEKVTINGPWLKKELTLKTKKIDWKDAVLDVRKFLSADRRASLELWSSDFFQAKISKMKV